MSSEGSVSTSTSSRIRQFGLYRSIDRRTEEFLKLSRKRQIKQGCACAAISTAITVTVVITVFLIYMEYGMNTETNQQSLEKSTWMSLLNDSLVSSFEDKFSKNIMNLDRTTMKLIPILIKALKQNRFLEKILDDYSSSSPAYDAKVTTEFSFKRDIFVNTKSFMKKPTSRLYTIEYKTSPVVFLKNPTRDVGYFTKNRKIREYKRMMGYLEKMINDKVGITAHQGLNTDSETQSQIEKQLKKPNVAIDRHSRLKLPKALKPSSSNKKNKISKNKVKESAETNKIDKDNIVSCNCPRHLNLLLNKIFSSIQQLIPDGSFNKLRPCNNKSRNVSEFVTVKNLPSTTNEQTTENKKPSTSEKSFTFPLKFSEFNNIFRKHNNKAKTESTISTTTDPTTLLSMGFGKTSKSNILASTANVLHTMTAISNHAEPTETNYGKNTATQPIKSVADTIERKIDFITTTENNKNYNNIETTNKYNETSHEVIVNYESLERSLNTPDKNNNDGFILKTTTATNIIDKLNEYNTHSIELFKSNIMTPSNRYNITPKFKAYTATLNKTTSTNKRPNKYTTTEKYVTSIPKHKQGKTKSKEKQADIKTAISIDYKEFNMKDLLKPDKDMAKSNIAIISPPKDYEKVASSSKTNINMMRQKIKFDKEKKKLQPFFVSIDNAALEEEIEKITHEDDYQQEDYIKRRPDNTATVFSKKNTTTPNQNISFKAESAEYGNVWKMLSDNEAVLGPNSMVPHSRPTYLEIHRNNWKHDETNDYDTNMKYNSFDLL